MSEPNPSSGAAADAVGQSEAKYRLLFQAMAEGFALYELVKDPAGQPVDWRVLEVNDAYTRHTGIAREAIVGRRISEVFPVAIPGYLPIFARVVATQTPEDFETFSKATGRHQHVVTFPAGGDRFANVIEDITARKRAEEELRRLNALLEQRVAEQTLEIRRKSAYNRSLIEASLDPLVTIGLDGKITDVNGATEDVTGRPRGELIGTDFSTYFTEPGRARAGCEEVFRTGLVRDYALSIRHTDGHTTPILFNVSVYRDEAGKVAGAFAAARDITERQRAEEALKAERQRLYDVLEMLPVYVILLSEDYRVPFANRFFRERFGESGGRRCYEYLFARTEPCENCESYKALKTGAPHHWYWTGPDGRDYDIYDYPFKDATGAPMIMEMGIDITEVKKAQTALTELNATLERRVTERTVALADSEERLRLAQEAGGVEVWDFDPRRGVMQCSPLVKAWWGLSPEDCYTYDTWVAGLHPEDRDEAVAGVRWSLEPDGPGRQDLEYRVTQPGRPVRWVGVQARTQFDEVDGRRQAVRIIGTMQDITARRQAENDLRESRVAALNMMQDAIEASRGVERANRELRASEESLKRSQEMAHLGSWELDLAAHRLTWSDEVYRIFGLRPQEFQATYEAFLERVHPDDRAAVDAAYSSSLRENRDSYEIEHRVVRQGSDEVRIVRERCEHVRDKSGRIVRSVGMVHDITELRRLQEQEKMAAEQLARAESSAATIRTMCEGVVLATRDGTVLSINPAVETLTGLAAADLIGRNLEAILPQLLLGEDIEEAQAALNSVRAGRIPSLSPMFIRPVLGPPVCVLPDVRFMGGEVGGPGGETVVLTLTDVTQIYEAEEKLRITGALLQLFVSTTSRKEYLDAAVNLLRDWSDCRCVGIRVVDGQGFIPYESCSGFSREFQELESRLSIASDACVCARVAAGTPEPQDRPAVTPGGSFCCDDTLRFVSQLSEAEQARYRGNCVKWGFASVAVVPILYQGQTLGAIHLADERRGRVSRESTQQLETLALMIGEALQRFRAEEDRARYEANLRSLAAALSTTEEENRWKISRQIHDTVVQSLSLSNIKLGGIRREVERTAPAEQQKKIDGVRALLDDAVRQARSLMTDLTPPLLYEMGLAPALEELAGRLREEHAMAIEVRVEESLPDPAHAVRGFLFASARELITNAMKHARARRIVVILRAGTGELVLQVRDDGQGFAKEAAKGVAKGAHDISSGGFGLFSIRERIEGLGGQFQIESAPGKGTTTTLTLPLRSEGEEEETEPRGGDRP